MSDTKTIDTSQATCCEIITGRFYFMMLKCAGQAKPSSTAGVHYFSIDDALVYCSFYADFGPLDLGKLYRYCALVCKKLTTSCLANKKIVHYTSDDPQKRVNAAFLVGAYLIIYWCRSPDEAYRIVVANSGVPFVSFRDASLAASLFNLTLLDCLHGIAKALQFGFFDFSTFNLAEYEHYQRVENGDLNWIIPGKFLAFSGPHAKSNRDNGYPVHAPHLFLPYFGRCGVTTVVRLNRQLYNGAVFVREGIAHHDLFFPDGTIPTDAIIRRFFDICEKAPGVIAVHCKAGLGRTGTLIGCYLIKYYKMTVGEAIAWLRVARPGSVIGPQQTFLEEKQSQLWQEGDEQRSRRPPREPAGCAGCSPAVVVLDTVCLTDISDCCQTHGETEQSQGDLLNRLKALRGHPSCVAPSAESDYTLGDTDELAHDETGGVRKRHGSTGSKDSTPSLAAGGSRTVVLRSDESSGGSKLLAGGKRKKGGSSSGTTGKV